MGTSYGDLIQAGYMEVICVVCSGESSQMAPWVCAICKLLTADKVHP